MLAEMFGTDLTPSREAVFGPCTGDTLEAMVRRTGAVPGSARERADHELMGVINNWQLALFAYADDLRRQRQVVKSFEYLSRADEHLPRAQQMQRALERPSD
jgi:hypothetical protein